MEEPRVELIYKESHSVRRQERLLVWCIAVLALVLAMVRLMLQGGAADADAMTAAQSMAQSWRNFLYGTVDAAGQVTAGPPLARWPQAALAALLGASPLSVRLPQVLAVFAACLLAAWALRPAGQGSPFGGALAAGLALASPAVLALGGNAQGTLWALCSLLGCAALACGAAARGSAWRLALSALLAGAAFHMLGSAALPVLPALAVLWFTGSDTRRRVWAFAFALAVFAVAALAWFCAVAVQDASARPAIAGVENGNPFALLLEPYTDGAPTAVERLAGGAWGAVHVWWLGWGAAGGVAALLAALARGPQDDWLAARVQAFWLAWAAGAAALLAFAPQPLPGHALALTAALIGLAAHSAMVLLDGMDRPWVALATAAALFAAGIAQTRWLGSAAAWGRWAFVFPLCACAAALVLLVARLLPGSRPGQWRAVAAAGLLALLIAPAVFAVGALFGMPGNPVAGLLGAG